MNEQFRLVFVHLGTNPAKHLWANIGHLNSIFPELRPVVILDSDSNIKTAIKSNLNLEVHVYHREGAYAKFPNMSWDSNFRGGFWRFSTERIVALSDWHSRNPEQRLIHLESDIFLLPTFPFREISRLSELAWSAVSHDHDVAAVLYSPTPKDTSWLALSVLEYLGGDPSLNDMTLLNRIYNANSSRILTFPNWNPLWPLGESVTDKSKARVTGQGLEPDLGIIDGSTMGVWLIGQDPRNHFGKIVRHQDFPGSYTNTSSLDFHFDEFEGLFAEIGGLRSNVHCLHIHSKDLDLFSPSWKNYLRKAVEASRRKSPYVYGFSLQALKSALGTFASDLLQKKNFIKLVHLVLFGDKNRSTTSGRG